MTTDELRQIAAELRANGSDTHFVEAKRAQRQIPKRLRETLSAFANTSGGGVIVLGLDGESGFEITGVEEAGKLCQDLASLCGEMQPPVRALIQTHELKGKQVVTAEVPEADLQQKPCYYSGAGMNNGSFIRVGDGNRQLTHYEVAMFLASRGQPREDEQPVEGATLADLDPHFVTSFLGRLRASGSAFQDLSDEETLKRSKIMVNKSGDWMPSLAGLFALGRNPQQFFPSLCATLVVYPAEKVGEPGPNGERFLDNVRLDGPLPLMARAALLALQRNMKRRAIVRGLFREDTWEYPVTALREAVVNALVHRASSPTLKLGTREISFPPAQPLD